MTEAMTHRSVALVAHPGSGGAAPCRIEVAVALSRRGDLALDYRIAADTAGLRLPAGPVGRRADGLWHHTCCEAFIPRPGDAGYREFNFAPSGAWAAYDFAGYRAGGIPAPVRAPVITCSRDTKALRLHVTLLAADLPVAPVLRLGLAAIVEGTDGSLTHWALCHPADRPDFHHPHGFALELDAPAARGRC